MNRDSVHHVGADIPRKLDFDFSKEVAHKIYAQPLLQ